jgi:hypothetical protein
MTEQQNYYITPPTLFLPEDGLRITLLGTDEDWAETLGDDLEDTFPNIPMTLYHLDESTADNWQWLYHQLEHSNLVMINVACCTNIELMMAMMDTGNKNWFYVDPETVDKNVRMLLNTVNANVFNNSEQLHAMLRNFVGNE